MEQKEKIELVIEELEERIAPGVVGKGNNGFGNGGNDGSPNGKEDVDR